jgi:hypothetical protein
MLYTAGKSVMKVLCGSEKDFLSGSGSDFYPFAFYNVVQTSKFDEFCWTSKTEGFYQGLFSYWRKKSTGKDC